MTGSKEYTFPMAFTSIPVIALSHLGLGGWDDQRYGNLTTTTVYLSSYYNNSAYSASGGCIAIGY